jgi:hypothetical protein
VNTSFINRVLRATLLLPQGNFPGTNSNTLVLENFRMSARLTGAGNFTNQCALQIWGMRQVDMNAVTVLFGQDGNPPAINSRAILTLATVEANKPPLQVFVGQFSDAQPDYKELPDVCLSINAVTGLGQQYATAAPSSFPNGVDVATLAEQLATQMGYPFEDNGVTGTIATPYFAGTLMDQFRQLCEAARCDYYFDAKATLIICPKNQPRQNQSAVVLSDSTGLIGYPTLNRFGVEVDAQFQPAFELGSPIQIEDSDVPGTNGEWFPYQFAHDLDSVKPGGRWHSHLMCMRSPTSAVSE